jgi:hypothetical protein
VEKENAKRNNYTCGGSYSRKSLAFWQQAKLLTQHGLAEF